MKLDSGNEMPLYQQLKEEIKGKITDNTFPYGSKIPTETELSEIFQVSRITVRRAIQELCQENYLVKKQGKGTFVKHAKVARKIKYLLGFSKSCEANGMVPSRKVIKREIVELSDEDAKTMGLEAGSHAVSIERINLADGVPIMYEINLFPYQKFAFLLEEPLDGSLFELLEKKCHTIVSYSNNSYLDLARASGRIAKELRVPYELVLKVHDTGRLPVVNFAAGGVATPADAALMMQLGAEGVFVGSGIFKSGNPAKRAAAIVQAVTNYTDAKLIAELSSDLGEAMVGINEQEIELLMAERGK